MRYNNIAIAIPLEEPLLQPLHQWGNSFNWSQIKEVHLIHVVKKMMIPIEFAVTENPTPEVFIEMLPSLKKHLKEQQKKILPATFNGRVYEHISCDFSPEEKTIEIINHLHISLIVVSTHGRKGFSGLFHSSFTDYMIKFSPCDIFVVRPRKD